MKRVLLAPQMVEFIRKLAPAPQRRLRAALANLAHDRGDIKSLYPPLDAYCRLRVGGYRIVFAYGARNTIECIFAEQRSVVYELLIAALRDALPGR